MKLRLLYRQTNQTTDFTCYIAASSFARLCRLHLVIHDDLVVPARIASHRMRGVAFFGRWPLDTVVNLWNVVGKQRLATKRDVVITKLRCRSKRSKDALTHLREHSRCGSSFLAIDINLNIRVEQIVILQACISIIIYV